MNFYNLEKMLVKYIHTFKQEPNIEHREVHKLTLTSPLTAHWSNTVKRYLGR